MADEARWRSLFLAEPVARLATLRPDGHPHLVPITFAAVPDGIVTAVDSKPKRSRSLQRLDNIAADDRVAVLADHYADDWQRLWWVRADGRAAVVPAHTPRGTAAIDALVARYPRYRSERPGGPVILITVERWSGWQAGPD